MILGCMEVLAEAQTLSEKAGIGADAVHSLVKGNIHLPIFSIESFIHFCRCTDILPAGPYVFARMWHCYEG